MALPNFDLYDFVDGSGYYLKSDRSGPYAWNGTSMVLIGDGSGGSFVDPQLPPAIGPQTAANSLSVTPASAAAATLANVAASATSVTILAANAARRRAIVENDSASATLKLKFGATASATSYTMTLGPGDIWDSADDLIVYTGIIDGIWSAAVGAARTTEI